MNEKEINVLMILPTLRVSNGVGSFAMSYYRKLDHKRVHMDFVLYHHVEGPYIEEIESNGDHVFALPRLESVKAHLAACKKILTDKKYDIVHNNSLTITLPIMMLARRRVPVRILHSHSSKLGEDRRRQTRNQLFIPMMLFPVNRYAACSSLAGKAIFGRKPFDIIPDVIHTDAFRFSEETREEIRRQEKCEGKFVIGSVGRICDAKNPFFAIDVMERVIGEHPEVEYWWLGSGNLDEQVREYIKSKGLEDKIILKGSRSDIGKYYQAMDLFIMPSKFEGFGLACVEAQTAGLYCVVSDQLIRELDFTGNVGVVPIDKGTDEWVDTILAQIDRGSDIQIDRGSDIQTDRGSDTRIDRSATYELALASDFSDETAGTRLTEYYYAQLR